MCLAKKLALLGRWKIEVLGFAEAQLGAAALLEAFTAWRGASARTDAGWTAEFLIPWSTVAMPDTAERRHMGIYMSRKFAYLDERVGWPALPFTQPKFMSVLQPLEMTDVAPRQQYNIYPYGSVTRDEIDDKYRYRAGVDVFWRELVAIFVLGAFIYTGTILLLRRTRLD